MVDVVYSYVHRASVESRKVATWAGVSAVSVTVTQTSVTTPDDVWSVPLYIMVTHSRYRYASPALGAATWRTR